MDFSDVTREGEMYSFNILIFVMSIHEKTKKDPVFEFFLSNK